MRHQRCHGTISGVSLFFIISFSSFSTIEGTLDWLTIINRTKIAYTRHIDKRIVSLNYFFASTRSTKTTFLLVKIFIYIQQVYHQVK